MDLLFNAIESINAQLRKIIKTRGHFPTDDAATKLIWLALQNITANWGKPAHDWKNAMNQFAVLYGDRFIRRQKGHKKGTDLLFRHLLGNKSAPFFSVLVRGANGPPKP
jgi:hypothetical protein